MLFVLKIEYFFVNCKGCYYCYFEIQVLFLVKLNQFMGLVKENLFFIVSKEVKIKLCKVGEIKEIV